MYKHTYILSIILLITHIYVNMYVVFFSLCITATNIIITSYSAQVVKIKGLNFSSRSYYRCTNSKCTVKKRVERSSDDPSVVITTYEGQHCHSIGPFQRGGGVGAAAARYHSAAAVALAEQMYSSSTTSSFIPAARQQLFSLPPLHPQSSPPSSETTPPPVVSSVTTTSFQRANDGDELWRTGTGYGSGVSVAQSPSTPPSVPPPVVSVQKAGLLDDMVPHGVRHGTP
jgi:hypothetical protein